MIELYDEEIVTEPEIQSAEPVYLAHVRDGREVVSCGSPGLDAESLARHLQARGLMEGDAQWRVVDAEYRPDWDR